MNSEKFISEDYEFDPNFLKINNRYSDIIENFTPEMLMGNSHILTKSESEQININNFE